MNCDQFLWATLPSSESSVKLEPRGSLFQPPTAENGVAGYLAVVTSFTYMEEQFWSHIQESSLSYSFNDTSFSSVGLSWPKQWLFRLEPCSTRNRQNLSDGFSQAFYAKCSVYNRPREMKQVSVEPSGNGNYEYPIKIVLKCLWTKRRHKMSSKPFFAASLGSGWILWVTSHSQTYFIFAREKTQSMVFKKNAGCKYEQDKMLKDQLFFQI